MTGLVLGLALWLGAASACEPPKDVPSTLQVAWVSPVQERVRSEEWLQVVRTVDLRKLSVERKKDPVKVLQALGQVGKRGKVRGSWKVTLFDVKAEWLCRPLRGTEGSVVGGVPVCEERQQARRRQVKRPSWTSCGYLLDPVTALRTLDTFRIRWKDAISWGFCVLPLERFLGQELDK